VHGGDVAPLFGAANKVTKNNSDKIHHGFRWLLINNNTAQPSEIKWL
jgi:hypothetical protein